MGFRGARHLVVMGFGAIGSGLFVYEAGRTGDYAPPLVVDVRAELVAALRASDGRFRVNIARADRIEVADEGPVLAADSTVDADRELLVQTIAEADELASALPSVAAYRTDGPDSPHRLIAEGLQRRTRPEPLIVYCAENHRSASALLEATVLDAIPPVQRDDVIGRVRFADTVIGKMSGVITDESELSQRRLATITPSMPSAYLVEAFDRILVSRLGDGLAPGMPKFREEDDLAPFEDAKLLGHNATHALAGFLGSCIGLKLVADLQEVDGAMTFLRAAFVEESGASLCRRWAGTDELFTPRGFAAYADDLLERMVNPYLGDTIERAARDPRRKLGWDDRLVGLIRLGLAEGVPTLRYAMGVAAGLELLRRDGATGLDADLLRSCWPPDVSATEAGQVIDIVNEGRARLGRWLGGGFGG